MEKNPIIVKRSSNPIAMTKAVIWAPGRVVQKKVFTYVFTREIAFAAMRPEFLREMFNHNLESWESPYEFILQAPKIFNPAPLLFHALIDEVRRITIGDQR